MIKRLTSGTALIFLSGTLVFTSAACNSYRQVSNKNENTLPFTLKNSPSAVTKPTITTSSLASQPSEYDLALDKAYSAISISQSAQSADDWRLVENQWQEAIALLQAVPKNSPHKAIAQAKVTEYQRRLRYAHQQANRSLQPNTDSPTGVLAYPPKIPVPSVPNPATRATSPLASQDQSVFQAIIKRRIGGTPVIDVTFNGTQKIEMIVDTGASSTVVTQRNAVALGVVPVTTAQADTASAKGVNFPVGYVNSIQVGGAMVRDIPVAIAPTSVLETGLLGHDFFGNYDITIKRDVVEFHLR